jgi:hypothetical protein
VKVTNSSLAPTGLTVTGGNASALTGITGTSIATANAVFSSTTDKTITLGSGDIVFSGGNNVNADGVNATATAVAGTDSGNGTVTTLATALTVTATGGKVNLVAGNQYIKNGGSSAASAVLQSTGGIKIFGSGTSTQLAGGANSGLFQNVSSTGTIISLTGLAPPIETSGGFNFQGIAPGVLPGYTASVGIAVILSGAPPSNLDPLQAGLLSSLSSLLKTSTGPAPSSSSSSKADKPNYCK